MRAWVSVPPKAFSQQPRAFPLVSISSKPIALPNTLSWKSNLSMWTLRVRVGGHSYYMLPIQQSVVILNILYIVFILLRTVFWDINSMFTLRKLNHGDMKKPKVRNLMNGRSRVRTQSTWTWQISLTGILSSSALATHYNCLGSFKTSSVSVPTQSR